MLLTLKRVSDHMVSCSHCFALSLWSPPHLSGFSLGHVSVECDLDGPENVDMAAAASLMAMCLANASGRLDILASLFS